MASTSKLPATEAASAMQQDGPSAASMRQVPIKLFTSQATLSIPDIPYLIPTSWQRAQLSTLVNRLLKGEEGEDGEKGTPSIPFDFIIDGELLRTSISQYLERKGLTEESTLDIEYVRSTLPPTFTASFEHDDWISAVDASRSGYFLTSSYDGSLRVFGTSTVDNALVTYRPAGQSAAALTNACWLPNSTPDASAANSIRVASAGMDGVLRISRLHVPSEGEHVDGSGALPVLESIGTTNAFETPSPLASVAVNSKGDTLVTGGWDGSVAIWNANESAQDADEDRNVKRRKGAKGDAREPDQTAAKMKAMSLFWHVTPTALANTMDRTPNVNARVARALWNGDRSVVSAGWDGSVRAWDVSVGACTTTKTSDKVILSADSMSDRDHIVTGHMDRSAALWDTRTASTTNISIAFANAHAAPVSMVKGHPTSAQLFASGAHDGTVKLWDTRSPRTALFSLLRPTGKKDASKKQKILALDWDPTGQTIVAGGEDCELTVHRGHDIGRMKI